ADAELTMRALRRNEAEARIHWVKDGAEALEYLFSEGAYAGVPARPRLIMLDIKMPKIDGLEVLRRVKMDPDRRVIPVVVMTSSKEQRDILESYHLGANSYVVKPVQFDAFLDAVTRIGVYWLRTNQAP
ncbi:MAG TPA: response regulator, partial [Burkholderiales bacterium]|nr:response regulator [Burkholderiales bacterium]